MVVALDRSHCPALAFLSSITVLVMLKQQITRASGKASGMMPVEFLISLEQLESQVGVGCQAHDSMQVAGPKDLVEKGTMPKARRLRVITQALSKGSRTLNAEANLYPKLCVRDPCEDHQGGTGIKKAKGFES